jgi:hypothetical protein
MNNRRPPHPTGIHTLKLIDARLSQKSILMVQCIFEGTGENKRYFTLSRTISRHSPWAISSEPFLSQLNTYDPDSDLVEEIIKNLGQEFVCLIKEGKGFQRNITRFLERPNYINDNQHVLNGTFTGEEQVSHV